MVEWSAKLPRRHAWMLSGTLVLLAGVGDLLSGTELWFGPVYLLVLCFPAWALGWRQAVFAGLGCVCVSLIANGPDLYPLGTIAIVWNMLTRVLSVTIIVLLVSGARRSYDRERSRARTDALTGLLNKHAFDEDAAAAMAQRGRWKMLAYMDLDGFKQINDRYGHAEGDRVLRAFAATARAVIREGDVLARTGGDEFLLLASSGSEAGATALAGKLHARLNAALAASDHRVKCSTGALVIGPEVAALGEADIQAADRLMYKAKTTGSALMVDVRRSAAVHTQNRLPAFRPPITHLTSA